MLLARFPASCVIRFWPWPMQSYFCSAILLMFPECCKDCHSNFLFCVFFKFPFAVLHWIPSFIKLNISFLLPSQLIPSSHQVTSNMQLAHNQPPSLVCPWFFLGVTWSKLLSNLLKWCPQSNSKIGIICAIHVLHISMAYYGYQFLVHSLWTTASLHSPIFSHSFFFHFIFHFSFSFHFSFHCHSFQSFSVYMLSFVLFFFSQSFFYNKVLIYG